LTRLRVEPAGPELAELVHRLTRAAFLDQARLDPPSGAGRETVETVRGDLAAHGGAVAWRDGEAAGCLRFAVEPDHLYVYRVAVAPELQGRGVGRALMAWAEAEAARRVRPALRVGVRLALTGNLTFFGGLGFEVGGEHRHPGYDRPTAAWLEKRLQGRPAR